MNDSVKTEQLVRGEIFTDYATPDETRTQYLNRVEESGLRVVVPRENELQIDIDSEERLENHRKLLSLLSSRHSWVPIDNIQMYPSRSGLPGKYHIVITLAHNLDPWERIAWQAALGSDSIRELFSCIRMHYGEVVPVCFFEKE